MDKLIPAFEKSLFDSNLTDLAVDTIEFGIDSLLDDGPLKNIPIVSTIIGMAKTAQNIYDRNLLSQTAVFITEFNSGVIAPDKLRKYRQKIDNNPKCAEKELSRVLILLNTNIDSEKSKILAKFYRAYVEEKINWDQFCELSEALHQIFIADVKLLNDIYECNLYELSSYPKYRFERLISLGLVSHKKPQFSLDPKDLTKHPDTNELGSLFYQLSK